MTEQGGQTAGGGSAPEGSEPVRVTFGIIARRRIPELERLVDSLLQLDGADANEIVVGVETPGCQTPAEECDERGVRWLQIPARRGLGYNRNRVLEAARGELLFSIDDDCVPQPGWYEELLGSVVEPGVDAAVGDIRILPAGLLGDSISALGFPAGGSAGYATMFPVADDGSTNNIAIGNCVLRAATVRDLGGFDESMTYGGEDTELAHRFNAAGRRILFVPSAVIVHPARTSLAEFVRWSYVRGRAKAQYARRVPAIGGLVGNRLASYGRILARNARDPKILLIAPLLFLNLVLQQAGFIAETLVPRRND
jgi:GT2 family glycosyltransferase